MIQAIVLVFFSMEHLASTLSFSLHTRQHQHVVRNMQEILIDLDIDSTCLSVVIRFECLMLTKIVSHCIFPLFHML